jgi:S-adenosyl methyltransferase
VAEKLLAVYPPVIETVPESRRFVERAVTWVAGQGITQFIDLGAGLPTSPNAHVTAQEASPAATVAYVDNDPVVISHLTALLAHHSDGSRLSSGDLRDRDAILGAPGFRRCSTSASRYASSWA